ncbi:MAG: uroporphyrinogen decarboxylase family protein [Anaerolineae bacterium]
MPPAVPALDSRTRLQLAFDLERPDRPPILGGWLAAPAHIQALTGCSEDQYWDDPFHWGLAAERVLGSDGVIGVFQPIARGGYRCVDGQVLQQRAAYTLDAVVREIEAMPEPEEVKAAFDEERAYAELVQELGLRRVQCGDVLWCPADWSLIPKALWYHEYGHENALSLVALYPEVHRKLLRVSAVRARQHALLRARAMRAGLHPRAILCGEDLCTQRGPMVSPDLLRREYFPLLEYALEPVLAAGARVVWHCDGDYRPLLDDVLACGIGGLQGFQRECGMDLEWIVDLQTRTGEPLLIFGPLSVTTTLPHGTPEDVRAEVCRAMDLCRDSASLVFFTSNTITPDVPLENIRAYWSAVLDSHW